MINKKALVIFGPTASGKSSAANKIAEKHAATIINADSIQVYQDLRLITSRPSIEDENRVDHRLYGFLKGDENCTLSKWLNLVKKEINLSLDNNKLPIIVGGTGMYLKGLIDGISSIPKIPNSVIEETKHIISQNGLDFIYKILAEKNQNLKINPSDTQRIQRAYNVFIGTGKTIEEWNLKNKKIIQNLNLDIVIQEFDRSEIYRSCEKRFDQMIECGGIEEIERLLEKKYDPNLSIMKAIGVREISKYLNNELSLQEASDLAKQKTRNYIKRQITWIKGNNITQNSSIKKYI
tara:strand:- start:980 stop:1858 length:879 start_codon:yes stop_codon:yes gene_type:complete